MAKKRKTPVKIEYIYSDILEINITERDGIIDQLIIENCPNLVSISIDNANILCAVLENCNNINSISYISIKGSQIEDLQINSSNFMIDIKASNLNGFTITDSSCEYLRINDYDTKNESIFGSILIDFCTIKTISFLKSKVDDLTLSNLHFSRLEFTSLNCNHLKINQITGQDEFKNIFKFDFGDKRPKKIESTISFSNCTFFESFELNNFVNDQKDMNYKIEFSSVKLVKSGKLIPQSSHNDGANFKVILVLIAVKFNEGLTVASYIENEKIILNTNIIYSTECEGILKFRNLHFQSANLIGANLKLMTSFDQCAFGEISFLDFDNKSTVKFTNTHVIEKLDITNSDLNDVIFRPLKANSLHFQPDSFLGGMKIYGSDAINLEKTDLSPENKQEFYRQLKQAAKNSNNKFLELEYKAKEMAHYKPFGWGDKRSHWVNSLSDHGTNWVKPLLYIIFWNFVIWLLLSYNLYTSYFVISLQKGYSLSEILLKLSFGFWIVLNPVSRMSEFSAYLAYKQPIHYFVPFLFFGAKILNGVLIYQMISAFRKWVGKD